LKRLCRMFSKSFIDALVRARRRFPHETWRKTIEHLSRLDGTSSVDQVIQTLTAITNHDIAWLLGRTIQENANLSSRQIAAAMSVVDALVTEEMGPSEIMWSGPPDGIFPVRRIDQVLYDLINQASDRVLLVTFAAHRIEHLCSCLYSALSRNVSLTLILEAEQESEGQLSRDALSAFSSISAAGCRTFYWPIDQRSRNAAGRPGKLHAKCAVIDSSAIIGSANLTDDAFNRNLEMGILLRDGPTPDRIFSHFNALIDRGVFREFSP
jgi:cardiolipin synthase A/B